MAFARITGDLGHGQRQHRPQPLTAGRDQVIGDFRNHRDVGTGARQDRGVDALHVGATSSVRPLDRRGIRISNGITTAKRFSRAAKTKVSIETLCWCGKV